MADAEVVAWTMRLLRRMLPDAPDPTATLVTRWASDPLARGAYCHVPPGARVEDYDALARAVGRLHFAGDATSRANPGTTQGALDSGRRAAREALAALRADALAPRPLDARARVPSTRGPEASRFPRVFESLALLGRSGPRVDGVAAHEKLLSRRHAGRAERREPPG
jgi:lysine-specific histone demethylase 1